MVTNLIFFDTPLNILGRYLILAFFSTLFNKNGIPGNIKKKALFYFCLSEKNIENVQICQKQKALRRSKK